MSTRTHAAPTTARFFSSILLTLVTVTLLWSGTALAANSPLDGQISVVNERMTTVRVFIDGEPAGKIAPGKRKVFSDVPNGVRLVAFRAPGTKARVSRVTVPISGLAATRAEPIAGLLKIRNRSEVPMKVSLDGRQIGKMRSGANLKTPLLPPGRYELIAKPIGPWIGAAPIKQTVAIRAGEITKTKLKPWLASITVKNPFDRPAGLFVDGKRIARIAPRSVITVTGQAPGRHKLTLRRRGQVLSKSDMVLSPGETAAWRPVLAQRGHMQLTNYTGKTLTLSIDGVRVARFAPGESKVFHGLTEGRHLLEATTPRGRKITQRFRVKARAITQVALRPQAPMTAVVLPAHR